MTTGRRRVLDLFCKAGAAGYGYYLAGCEVTGVDIEPQPRYPFPFIQADAMRVLADDSFLRSFSLIHASPPCQAWSEAAKVARSRGAEYPELIVPVRERLAAAGVPYVIENIERAPLVSPVMLCGAMFGLRVYRHRLFECSFPVTQPSHPEHLWSIPPMGRKPAQDQFHVMIGHFPDVARARLDSGIAWMTQGELAQAVPPAFTRYIAESGGARQCAVCLRWWSPRRSHAVTCSPRCRKALSRSRIAVPVELAGSPGE